MESRAYEVIFAVLILVPTFVIGQGPSWFLQNPSPTGNALQDVYFLNPAKGWAIGNQGTLLKTTDSGRTWTQVLTPKNGSLRSMTFRDSMDGWAVGGVFGSEEGSGRSYILRTQDGGNTWFELGSNLGLPHKRLHRVHFSDERKGWISSGGWDSNLYVTEDGGETWSYRNVPNSHHLMDVFFLNSDTGFVGGDLNLISRTIDGGKTWEKSQIPSGTGAQRVQMLTSKIGYAFYSGSSSGNVLKTVDGGLNWNIVATGPPIGAMHFSTPDSGIIFAHANASLVMVTSDGGSSWTGKWIPNMQKVNGVASPIPGTIFAVCWNGGIFKSLDINQGFEEISRGTGFHLLGIGFSDIHHGFTLDEKGSFFATSDGGINWMRKGKIPELAGSNISIKAFSSLRIMVTSSSSIPHSSSSLVITEDGGYTWKNGSLSLKPVHGRFLNPTFALGISDTLLMETTDGGRNWVPRGIKIPESSHSPVAGSFLSTEGGYVATQRVSIYKTKEGGRNWSTCGPIDSQVVVQDLAFVSKDTGWVIGVTARTFNSKILKTVDGCMTWVEQRNLLFNPDYSLSKDTVMVVVGIDSNGVRRYDTIPIPGPKVEKIRAFNGSVAWVVSNRGILGTVNGGESWIEENLPQYGVLFNDIALVNESNVWICGNHQSIWKYGLPDGAGLKPRKSDKPNISRPFWIVDGHGIPRLIMGSKNYDLRGRRIGKSLPPSIPIKKVFR